MDAMDAVALGARVQQVADKLLQKAQEARARGNAGAVQSLTESVNDLRHAAAVLVEQKRLLTVRQQQLSESSAGAAMEISGADGAPRARLRRNSSASSIVSTMSMYEVGSVYNGGGSVAGSVHHYQQSQQHQDLVSKLSRVEKMLGKKSDEMKAKGNENASNALQQSATYVRNGCGFIMEQQHQISALMSAQEKLQIQWEMLRKLLAREEENGDRNGESGRGDDENGSSAGGVVDKVAALITELSELKRFLQSSFPGCSDCSNVQELADYLQRERDAAPKSTDLSADVKRLEAERDQLHRQLAEAKKLHAEEYLIAREDIEILKSENGVLEKQLRTMEIQYHEQSERELAKLHAVYAAEKKSHEEMERVLSEKESELEALAADVEMWKNKFHDEQQKRNDSMAENQKHYSVHDEWVVSLQNDLTARNETITALETALKEKEKDVTAAPPAVDANGSPVSSHSTSSVGAENETALRELQAQYSELQAKLADCQQQLQDERAQVAEIIRERDEFEARILAIENDRERELVDLNNANDSKIAELEQKYIATEQEMKNLVEKVELLTTEANKRERISGELKEAVDGYRDACTNLRKNVEDRELTISRLEADLEKKREAVNGDLHQLDATLAAVKSDILELTKCLESSKNDVPSAIVNSLSELSLHEVGELRDAFIVHLKEYGVLKGKADQLHVAEQDFRETIDGFLDVCASYFGNDLGNNRTERLNHVKSSIATALKETKSVQKELADKVKTEQNLQQQLEDMEELQHNYASSTDRIRRLEEQVDALSKEKSELESAIQEYKSKSMDDAGKETERAKEIEELRQQLKDVEGEFERYRTRSHTALKKIEKRAELLNGMRKENEQLKKQFEESVLQYQDVLESERRYSESLHEATRTQNMMQEEFQQRIAELADELEQYKARVQKLVEEQQQRQREIDDAKQAVVKLVQEKHELADSKQHLFEQEKEAVEAELASLTLQFQRKEEEVAVLTKEVEEQRKQVETHLAELEQRANECEQLKMELRESEDAKSHLQLASDRSAVDDGKLRIEQSKLDEAVSLEKVNSEKTIANLEAQIQLLKVELTASKEEIRYLSRTIEAKPTGQGASSNAGLVNETESRIKEPVLQQDAEIVRLQEEKTTLVAKQKEQQERISQLQSQIAAFELKVDVLETQLESSQSHDGRISQQASPAQKLDSAKDELIKDLRHQVFDLQEQLQVFEEEQAAQQLEEEKEELKEMQAARLELKKQNENVIKLKQRKALVVNFKQDLKAAVKELQHGLDEHSAAFRDACEYRDSYKSVIREATENQNPNEAAGENAESAAPVNTPTRPRKKMDEFEEYLVMNSGVVIKAGSSFKLPVFCEKKGWRVVWKFTVKEESADVGFALVDQRGNKTVVAPDRVNELSGVYNVDADATTLLFEWDNSFSWLTEKTLDYHVSVQEPLTPAKQVVKAQERSIHHSSQRLRDGIAILSTEVMRRTELKHAAERLRQSEQEKETYLQQFQDRKEDIVKQKSDLQAKMEVLKNALSEMFTEQDEIEEDAKALEKAWNGAIAEQEDAETTIRLAETSQLELLAQELEEQVQRLEQELFSVRDQMSTA